MNRMVLAAAACAFSGSALAAAPSALTAAIAQWASPAKVARYQYSMVDLNGDTVPDAVVLVTDPASCGNGGCPLLVFKGVGKGYEAIANSGFVRKPIYLLKERNYGWQSLAAVVGFEPGKDLTPIRYKGKEYNSAPYNRMAVQLTSRTSDGALDFSEEAELKMEEGQ